MKQVLFGARIFDGTRFHDNSAVVVDNGLIEGIIPYSERPKHGVMHDLAGGFLSPGLIDWQINGGGGVLFNETPSVAGIRSILSAHRKYGTTECLVTVITDSQRVMTEALVAAKAAKGFVPGLLGIHVEGPFIDDQKSGAHPREHIRNLSNQELEWLIRHKSGVMVVTLAPNKVSPDTIKQLVRNDIIVSVGHSNASDIETLDAIEAGASGMTHLFNAMSAMSHRMPGMVGVGLSDSRIICGLIADGHHVAQTAIKVAIAARGPKGLALVSDAMPSAAGGPDHFELQKRSVRREGTRLTLEDETLAGSNTTLLESIHFLVRVVGIELGAALEMATLTPARLLKINNQYGRIAPKFKASLLHLSSDLETKQTWIDGVPSEPT
jgi:N-acetylglucosamine-6-phosphate deacetylase